jgi:hypothetical protein
MSASQDALLARRRELIAQSDAHREEIALCVDVWRGPLEGVDRAIAIVGKLQRHAPWIATGLAALWMAARGRGRRSGKESQERSRSHRGGPRRAGLFENARTAWRVAQTVASVASSVRRGRGWMA